MNNLGHLWNTLRESFWFLPSLIVVFSMAAALGLIEADSRGSQDWMDDWPRLFGSNAAGAREMLATVAGSMMTVVGVTFSMTLVTLALASSQYTSRILRNFMRDHATQAVLGIFAGIFIYCIIVLRSIRGGDEGGFVPSLSVAFSLVLAIGGIVTLIFFIHHIASSIQASSIVASVAKETLEAVDRRFPERQDQDPFDGEANRSLLPLPARPWQAVMASRNGYLQEADEDALLRLARGHKTVVRMDRGIGEFVVQNTPLASVALENPPDEEIIAALHAAYSIDRNRTVRQDCAFGIRQLVDMALHALSPGINDTTTAVTCVDYLSAILARVAPRDDPSPNRYEDGELRVIAVRQTFASLVGEAFDQIRGSSAGNVAIMLRMLGALQTIGSLTDDALRLKALWEQAEYLAELAGRTIESPRDKARFEVRMARLRDAVQPGDGETIMARGDSPVPAVMSASGLLFE